MNRARNLLTIVAIVTTAAQAQINLSGIVSSSKGTTLDGAIVTLVGRDLVDQTDVSGRYAFQAALPARPLVTPHGKIDLRVHNGMLSFQMPQSGNVSILVFDATGKLVLPGIKKTFYAGNHRVPLTPSTGSDEMLFVKLAIEGSETSFKLLSLKDSYQTRAAPISSRQNSKALASNVAVVDTLRASAPGHLSKQIPISAFNGVHDFVLDTLVHQSGMSSIEDGSADRLATYGVEQYYWGDMGNGDEPMVKIVTAVSPEVVDMALVFNPGFVDLTYGQNKVGWNKHSFMDLVRSDHVQVAVKDGNGAVVWEGKIDLLTQCSDAPSGYCTHGPHGGDGDITAGSADDVISYSTSFDENLNYYGYELFDSSPATDATYTPHPDYPNWQYYAVYRLSLDPSIFGDAGFGSIYMTSVHASPAKSEGSDTVPVTEGEKPSDQEDPFKYLPEDTFPPTDSSTTGDQPTDGSDTSPDTAPPDDGSSTDSPPITDGSDPSDSTSTPTDGSDPSDSTSTPTDGNDGSDTDTTSVDTPPEDDGSSTDVPPTDVTDTTDIDNW